jgi:hypothetical protein
LLTTRPSHLKPGGYIEFQELEYSPYCDDDSVTPETPYAVRDFLNFLDAGLRNLGGSELNGVLELPEELRFAGFKEVTETTHKCPIGSWPQDKRLRLCGQFTREAMLDGLRGICQRPFGKGLNWSALQIEMFLVDVRKHIMDERFHIWFPFHVIYAQKPRHDDTQ